MAERGEAVNGHLEFHSETGTEGGHWAFFDERYQHRRGEPCPNPDQQGKCWADHPSNPRGIHASYAGLHVLQDGDWLTIWDDADKELWSGVIDLIRHPLFTEDASGMWIHADQRGMPRDLWAGYFFAELPATWIPKPNEEND